MQRQKQIPFGNDKQKDKAKDKATAKQNTGVLHFVQDDDD
jgi:hypothetical protein